MRERVPEKIDSDPVFPKKGYDPFFLQLAVIGAFAILSSTLSKTPVLPLFARDLGASPVEIGWIVIASTIPGILASWPAGILADRIGPARVLLASLVVFTSAPWLYLLVSAPWQLMAVRFYHGFATAIFGTVATAVIARQFAAERAARLSTFSAVTISGRSVAPFLGGALISVSGFDAVYVACGVFGMLALATGSMLSGRMASESIEAPTPPLSGPHPAAPMRTRFSDEWSALLANRTVLHVGLIEATLYAVFGAVEAFLALYCAHQGIAPWLIGWILGIQLVGIIVLKPVFGRLSDRVGRVPLIRAGLLTAGIGVAAIPMLVDAVSLTAASLVFGLGFAAVTSSTAALAADAARASSMGSTIGALRTLMDIGQTTGPVVAGILIGSYGYGTGFGALAVLLAVATIGAWALNRKK